MKVAYHHVNETGRELQKPKPTSSLSLVLVVLVRLVLLGGVDAASSNGLHRDECFTSKIAASLLNCYRGQLGTDKITR